MGAHHHIDARQRGETGTHQVAQPTTDPVAYDGRTDLAGHHETDAWLVTHRAGHDVDAAHARTGLRAGTGRGSELGWPPQACGRREHESPCPGGQADSRSRPLRRRAAMMARPARVRIRRRNPWVLARRRLFG